MFPNFPSLQHQLKSADSSATTADSVDEVERLKAFQQECLQSLLLHQQQQQQQLQQNLSQLNKFMEPVYPAIAGSAPQKSMQDTLKCLKSLQLARSLETEATSRYDSCSLFCS